MLVFFQKIAMFTCICATATTTTKTFEETQFCFIKIEPYNRAWIDTKKAHNSKYGNKENIW